MLALHQKKIKTKVPITYTSNDPGLPWDFSKILKSLNNENYFSGGRVKVKTNFGDECVFHIRGKTPGEDNMKRYALVKLPFWYGVPIVRHETNFCQFNHAKIRNPVFNQGDKDRVATPNEAADGGVGLMQITKPGPHNKTFWNWKLNFEAGLDVLRAKNAEAKEYLQDQRNASKITMGYEVGLRKEKGEVISYWLKDSALLLELTTDLMEDISTIRAYNGGRFYRWKETGKKQGIWVVTEGQTYDFNDDPNQTRTNFYVRDILSQTKKEEL